MSSRYVLAPEAAQDLVDIWLYIRRQTSDAVADHIESAIRSRIVFIANNPGVGHWRRDLTEAEVKFFPVFSYLVVYTPKTKPLQVVSILHGRRDVERILQSRPGFHI